MRECFLGVRVEGGAKKNLNKNKEQNGNWLRKLRGNNGWIQKNCSNFPLGNGALDKFVKDEFMERCPTSQWNWLTWWTGIWMNFGEVSCPSLVDVEQWMSLLKELMALSNGWKFKKLGDTTSIWQTDILQTKSCPPPPPPNVRHLGKLHNGWMKILEELVQLL